MPPSIRKPWAMASQGVFFCASQRGPFKLDGLSLCFLLKTQNRAPPTKDRPFRAPFPFPHPQERHPHVPICKPFCPSPDIQELEDRGNTLVRQLCAHLYDQIPDRLPLGLSPKGPSCPKRPETGIRMHYTPEHCLVTCGFPLFWWQKPCFKWANCIF